MKLFRLPYIPTKLVLDHMPINHIFFLSLCSKSIKNYIKQIQKYQLKKIKRVHYSISKASIRITVGTRRLGTCKVLMVLYKTPINSVKRFSWCKEGDAVEEVQVKELGTSIDFLRSPVNQTDLHAKYTSDNAELIIESIHNHLCDLLGRDPLIWLMASFRETHFFPSLRNIRMLSIPEGDDSALTRINEILSRSPCLEVFSWWRPHRNDIKFEENSKVYEMDTLDVCQSLFLAKDVLKYFKGRHAFLSSNSIRTQDIIQFLNEWRSGEKFQNLEVISISSPQQIPDIRRSIEFKKLNKSVKYSYIKKHPIEHRMFKSRLYMVRESDGHVASVLLEHWRVFMGVWNMTEAEFLEKFQMIQSME